LTSDPSHSLRELAQIACCSPFHLSRRFHSRIGMPMSAYRLRLRVHEAHARIAAGEQNLARLAAELGFADHSHMTRTLREQLGVTPTAIRRRASAIPGWQET
jgi:AraC-like DNA-binding protein